MFKQVYDIILDIFSEKGFSSDGFSVRGQAPFLIELSKQDDVVTINFTSNKPVASFKKNLVVFSPSISVEVNGIVFMKDSGIIKLKNFVDIPFKY